MARGFHAAGDVIVTVAADGTSLNDLWDDYQAALNLWNTRRNGLVDFLTYRTTLLTEQLFEGGTLADFELATEYGVPVSARPGVTGVFRGYDFDWYDIAGRFTWKFLNKAPAAQINAFANQAFEADNRLLFMGVMKALFNSARRTAEEGHTVYPFWGGQVGDKPPDYKLTTFADSHNHYMTTGAATWPAAGIGTTPNTAADATDWHALIDTVTEHGYSPENGYTVVVMVNKAQGDSVRAIRSVANGGSYRYDFVPSAATAPFLLPTNMQVVNGQQPPSTIGGLTVIGSYGNILVVEEAYIPAGYFVCFATGGPDSLTNPIAIREDPNTSLQGLRLVKGREIDYPLIDSYYVRGFGTGIRNRGAGAVMQVTAGAYAIPTIYQ
jgi:hypothetical protein